MIESCGKSFDRIFQPRLEKFLIFFLRPKEKVGMYVIRDVSNQFTSAIFWMFTGLILGLIGYYLIEKGIWDYDNFYYKVLEVLMVITFMGAIGIFIQGLIYFGKAHRNFIEKHIDQYEKEKDSK